MTDEQTERAIIGGVLVHPRVIVDLGPLKAEDFWENVHRDIWNAIRALDADQKPVDVLSVFAWLEAQGEVGRLASFGGRDYLTTLMAEVVTVENLDYHAKRLRLLARRRAWRNAATRIAVAAKDPAVDAQEFLDGAERDMQALMSESDGSEGPQQVKAVLKSVVGALEKRYASRTESGISGVPMGLSKVDAYTLGFQPGDFVVIAARPSMGKTALAMNAVREATGSGFPALVFSLEMTADGLVERMIASQGGVAYTDIRTGNLGIADWQRLTQAASELSVRPMEIDERGVIDIAEIRRTARRWKAKHKKLGIIVIDYLQLIASEAGAKTENRVREVAEQSRALKLLAKELACPVVALAQLNRSLESRADKRPIMSDLKESGAIEQDADVIVFIYRDCVYHEEADQTLAEINIAKQRNGPTGRVEVRWSAGTQKFSDR